MNAYVLLLHGLAHTAASMAPMAAALRANGYDAINVSYPSRTYAIEQLAPMALESGLARCNNADMIHIVTHSLGGILVRQYLHHHRIAKLGRVVMLAPPNQGSEVVDHLKHWPGFKQMNGPAGLQLGTDANSIALRLGPADFELGVIAGTATINLLLSLYLPKPNDGKVSVESTKVEGMRDHISMPFSHPFIMRKTLVMNQTMAFLRNGRFLG